MNIPRIITFALVLLLLRIGVSFIVAGFPTREEVDAYAILQYSAGYILDAIVITAVFARFSQSHLRLLYVNALLVIVIQELLGAGLLLAMGETNPQSPLWLIDWVVLLISAVLGIELGRKLRDANKNKGLKEGVD